MIHLRRIAIRAYRSIVKADLRLGRITVIIGSSDSGKSNAVRALRDWAYNAAGTAFTTAGHGTTRVAVAVGETDKIVFEKSVKGKKGSTQFVHADAESGTTLSYHKVGLTVPEEVTDITKMRPVVIGDLSIPIQFSEQGEPWFLLAKPPWTPGTVSKVIGRVSGVDALILANRDLVNERGRAQRESKRLRAQIDLDTARLLEFDHVPALEEIVSQVEDISVRLQRNQRDLASATNLLRSALAKRATVLHAKKRRELLAAVVACADRAEIDANLVRLERADVILAAQVRSGKKLDRARARIESAREHLSDARADLAAIAQDKDLECPLCGERAHEECREALARAGETQ